MRWGRRLEDPSRTRRIHCRIEKGQVEDDHKEFYFRSKQLGILVI